MSSLSCKGMLQLRGMFQGIKTKVLCTSSCLAVVAKKRYNVAIKYLNLFDNLKAVKMYVCTATKGRATLGVTIFFVV